MNMPHLRKLVKVILLLFCAASYGSQVNTYDEHISSNHTASCEDYEQSFSSGLSNLLTAFSLYYDEYVSSDHATSYEDYVQFFYTGLFDLLAYLSLYYDEFRLRLRVSEIATVALVNFYRSKTGNAHNAKCIAIFLMGLVSSFLYNFACDVSAYFKSDESSLLAISRLIAKRAEHKLFLEAADYLAGQIFTGLCLICLEPFKNPALAACAKHFYCQACINEWAKQSPLCPVCH